MGTEPDAAKSFLPIEWGRAEGHIVWNTKGREYIDFTSGIFVANVGHNNQAVYSSRGATNLYHAYNYPTPIRRQYVDALYAKTGFECVALFCEGAVAVEAALRVMKKANPEAGIYTFKGSFHGKTWGTQDIIQEIDPDDERAIYEHSWGNWIIESYRGWDAHFWDKGLIWSIWDNAHPKGQGLMCFDEIQSGFGRTGRFFAYEYYGVKPDLVVFGKAAGGGLPLSGVLGPKKLLDLSGDLSATHSGWPMGCAAGLAVLEEMERLELVKEAERKGKILHYRLRNLKKRKLAHDELYTFSEDYRFNVYGRGMVAAILTNTVEEANRIVSDCYHKGLLVVHTGRESVKIGPPLTISDEALKKGLDILEEVLNE